MAKISIRNRNAKFPGRVANWEYRFEIAKIDGKRQCASKSGFKTKKEAQDAGAKALAEYNNAGTHFTPSEISVSDYLDQWFESYCKSHTRYNTQLSYLNLIENHLKPYLGHYKLKSLSPVVIQDYANNLNSKGYSKSLVYGVLSMLQNAVDYAVFPLGYIKDNPMRYVKIKYTADKPIRQRPVIKKEEFDKILEMFPSDSKFHLPLLLGWYCGLRISETCGLTWDDVDFENKTLNINKQIVRRNIRTNLKFINKLNNGEENPKGWYFTEPKFNSRRIIKISDALITALSDAKQKQTKDQKKYKELYYVYTRSEEQDEKGKTIVRLVPVQKMFASKEHNLVNMLCTDENGKMLTPEGLHYINKKISELLNITFDYHSLRHTHATLLIESGANVKTVQVRLGHKNVTTTLQKYVHDTEDMQDNAVYLFDKYSSGLKNISTQ